jgi:hypothetical protein
VAKDKELEGEKKYNELSPKVKSYSMVALGGMGHLGTPGVPS